MASTNWLGTLGSIGGGLVGAYYGGPMGAQAGSALGGMAGGFLGDEAGLGGDEEEGGGGGGGAPFQYNLMSTQDLFNQAGGMLPGLAESSNAFNFARQPGYTQSQLNAEQQIAPGTFDLRRDALAARQRDLNLGYSLPPELQDLVMTNALQQLGASGAGATDLGKLFGARSLAGAGLDRGEARIANALSASQFQPGYYQPLDVWGQTPGVLAAGDIRGREAAMIDQANLQQQLAAASAAKGSQDQSNMFSSLLGMAGGMMGGSGGGGGMGGGGGGFDLSSIMGMMGGGAKGTNGSAIGGPQYGIGARSGGGSSLGGSGSVWTQSFAM